MSTAALIALITAITALLGAIPAIILAFRGTKTAGAARQMAEVTFKALSDHQKPENHP